MLEVVINKNTKFFNRKNLFMFIFIWSFLVIITLGICLHKEKETLYKQIMTMARVTVHKDLIYHQWDAMHGCLYVPITDKTKFNIPLDNPTRDVETLTGERLTKINPAYITRQVFQMDVGEYNFNSRLISINALNPDNKPDNWEIIALKEVEKGLSDYGSMTIRGVKKNFRYLKPLVIENNCLSCHSEQGYKVGDIKGAISISIPISPLYIENKSHYIIMMGGFFILWLCGVISLFFYFYKMNIAFIRLANVEIALSESHERHQLLFEKAQDAIFILEGEGENTGKIIEANSAAAAMHGYTLEELLNLYIHDLDTPDAAKIVNQRIQEMHNGNWINNELNHVKKDGSVFPVEISAGLFDHKGKKYVFAIDRDISERQRNKEEKAAIEEQLIQVQKMDALGQLSGGIAHDFNNILFIIMGFTELSMALVEDQSVLKDNLLQIFKSSQRATEIVRQILTFSRQTPLNFKTVDFRDIMEENLSLLKAVIPSSINVKYTIAPTKKDESFHIIGNATKLHQVIVNLVTNAVQSMGNKTGNIIITLDNEINRTEILESTFSNCLKLTISDSGKGIADADIKKIFDPYFTTKDVGEGTGLGLSVVYGIIKSHKGDIKVESVVNKGTIFTIRLPLASIMEKEGDITNEGSIVIGYESILIVDDEEDLLKMYKETLEKIGYTVECETSSMKALALFSMEPGKFDLVITDMTMPHMNGMLFAEKLRDISRDIPIILCSGNEPETISKKGGIDVVNVTLIKPMSLKVFAETIRNLLDKS